MVEEFTKYVNGYDMNDFRVSGKYNHSLRVMDYCVKFAKKLNFSDEDVELARIIGLLHDFGRFEQLRVYDSFVDLKTIDHADYSVEQLFNKGEIKKYCTDETLYPIIEFAIKNHNKLSVPKVEDERWMRMAYLIRDADKTDIMTLLSKELKDRPDDSIINDDIKKLISNHQTIDKKYVVTNNDNLAVIYAYAFDLHYDAAIEDFKDRFIEFNQVMNGGEEFKWIYNEVISYLDERIENYERNRN